MKEHIEFYTDGSYNLKENKCSYGYIGIIDDKVKYKYCCLKEDNLGLKNVFAELKAVMNAIKFIKRLNLNYKVVVHYDFSGINNYLNNPKEKYITNYSGFINTYINFMKENEQYYLLKKVKAHNKHQWNILIDKQIKFNQVNEINMGKYITC